MTTNKRKDEVRRLLYGIESFTFLLHKAKKDEVIQFSDFADIITNFSTDIKAYQISLLLKKYKGYIQNKKINIQSKINE